MSTASDVLTPAAQQLQDLTNITWTVPSLVLYLNMFFRTIINDKPESSTALDVVNLVSGAIQQQPPGRINILDVTYNMGPSGAQVRGDAIQTIKREKMDNLVPGWTSFPPSSTVLMAILDDQLPHQFFVFPPQPTPATNSVELLNSIIPTMAVDKTTPFPLDDSYIPAAIFYVVGMALSEETSIPNALTKGQSYIKMYLSAIGIKTVMEKKSAQAQGNEPPAQQGQ